MPFIPLTKGCMAQVSQEDFGFLSGFSWYASRNHAGFYAVRKNNRIGNGKRAKPEQLYMHRVILGARPDEASDHINRNTLDNQRENLRIVDHCASSINRGVQKNSISGVTGLYYDRKKSL